MIPNNDPIPDTPLFSAVMTPNRSLGKRGFGIFMLAVAGVSFVAGLIFAIAGACHGRCPAARRCATAG